MVTTFQSSSLTGAASPYRAPALRPIALNAFAHHHADERGPILGSEVWQDGRHIGHSVCEPNADTADGRAFGMPDPARSLIFMKE
ncbi:hypothetical protein RAS12_19280 [Achromobacter seleniivolatilans]|uniref:DUF7259 domain-containing protein n=1 Tax=Achromobacter seleniivolatilans TaxID=3047478 RepID=A0ABY9LVD9_9BURK|nr:hypothetical protein [Achromobacter sp. R39]WMD18759.1 hypothetical protein RAS12_19280 [Achromobacter sp. R39]